MALPLTYYSQCSFRLEPLANIALIQPRVKAAAMQTLHSSYIDRLRRETGGDV